MKKTLKIDLPDRKTLVAGLAPRDVHPALVQAEEATAKAEQALERRRQQLMVLERIVADLPARIHRGEVKANALTEALRERDAAALLVQPATDTLAKVRERVPTEEKNAKLAVVREIERRSEQLDQVAKDIIPVLEELRELAQALARAQGPGWFATLDWTCPPACNPGEVKRG
jgi:hypothetical protein